MTPEHLRTQLATLTAALAGRPLDAALAAWLNREHGPQSDTFRQLQATCKAGAHDGWLCNRENAGIRYGRIFKPDEALHGFSVDVVDMESVAGPEHVHPEGEIDLIMPQSPAAEFDHQGAGWMVYGPGSQHAPTVRHGRALVLYLLPQGQIRFL